MDKPDKMMRRTIIIILALVMSSQSYGQNIRYWSEGPLKWKDFKMADAPDTKPSLSVSWTNGVSKVKIGKTVYKYIDIQTISNPENSWVGSAMVTDAALANQQDYFDQAEIIGRKMRDTLLSISIPMKELNRWASAWLKEGITVTPPGKDSFDITSIPLSISEYGFGGFVNFAGSIPAGDMSRLCRFFQAVSTGVEINKGRLYFDAGASFGHGTYLGDLFFFGWNAGPGYALLQGNHNRLSLFGLAGSKKYYFKPNPSGGISLTEGIRFDYLLREKYLFHSSGKARYRHWLQVSLFADQVFNSSKGIFIPTFNASIGLSFTRNGIKVK